MIEKQESLEDYNHEECGVFGIYAPNQAVAEMTYLALLALQHRGQDAAGVAVSGSDTINVVKNVGWVNDALDHGRALSELEPGEFASGHVRYSTNKSETPELEFRAAQPMFAEARQQAFTLSHNGHIIEPETLLGEQVTDQDITDSEVITQLISNEVDKGYPLTEAVGRACRRLNGAFTLVVMGQEEIIGLRDPKGFRPLVLGALPDDGGYVLASERAALDIIKASAIRDVEAGELVRISKKGISSFYPFDKADVQERLCSLEYAYFSRPDNVLLGENVEQVRFRMGQQLARQTPVEADIVIGVPNSGISSAHGFADESKSPIKQGLTKNSYIGRTFISTGQIQREQMTHIKLNVNKGIVEGQRVVVVDDSIIRGTTTKIMVEMLREAGATEVHLRITSPPYKWPCFYGMNTGDINELISAHKTPEEIREAMGADSLEYLSVDDFKIAMGSAAAKKVCMACMTGQYPTPVPPELLIKRSTADN